MIRVLIADDHPLTRMGIRAVLEKAADIQIVGEARDGTEAEQMATELCPDILLLDLVMPGPTAWEIEEWVRAHCPETVTLILTAHDRDYYLTRAVEVGVSGYLTKDQPPQMLLEAIRHAARGEALIIGEFLDRAKRWREDVWRRWKSLTDREQEVLRLLVQGLDNAAIAETLSITMRTTESHVTSILKKLDVSSRLEASAWVRDHLPEELWKSAM
jgi:NarL family two-component system response regulator LiaR